MIYKTVEKVLEKAKKNEEKSVSSELAVRIWCHIVYIDNSVRSAVLVVIVVVRT